MRRSLARPIFCSPTFPAYADRRHDTRCHSIAAAALPGRSQSRGIYAACCARRLQSYFDYYRLTTCQAGYMDVLQVPAERIRVIYEAAGDECTPVTDPAALATARGRYGLGDQYIFYLGGLDQRKNVLQLVRAFAHL